MSEVELTAYVLAAIQPKAEDDYDQAAQSRHNFCIKRLCGILAHAKQLLPPEDYEFVEVGVMPTLNRLREENARASLHRKAQKARPQKIRRIVVRG